MEQAEFWRRCEEDFLRYRTDENEKLIVRWEASFDDVWTFEGPLYCVRVFKALAKQAGYGLSSKNGPDAWKDWLDALRQNGFDSRVPLTREELGSRQERQVRRLLEASEGRGRGVLGRAIMRRQAERAGSAMLSFEASSGVINTPFRNSALFCLELTVDASTKPDEPDENTPFDWAKYLIDPSLVMGGPESDTSEVEGEASLGETSSRSKRGPKPDYATAARVAEIVNRIAGKEPWRSKIDKITDELDEMEVPCPKTWKAKEYRSWSTCAERHLVIEAIRHHLDNANKQATE
ncbi:MAG: hypothetical protein ABSG25_09285, partial [Bryobacteraceae bacterium]